MSMSSPFVCPSALLAQQSRELRSGAELAGKRLQAAVREMQASVDAVKSSLLGAPSMPATAEAAFSSPTVDRSGASARNGNA